MHATPDVVRPCVLSKGHDGMPRPTSFDRVCYQKAMMHSTPDVVRPCLPFKGYDGISTPDFVRPCVLPKGDDGIPRPMSFDHVCCPKEVMSCHA